MKNILFAGNYKVFDGFLTCMLSILKNDKGQEPFCFFVLTMDASFLKEDYLPLTQMQEKCLKAAAKSYHPENQVKVIDVTELYKKEFLGSPNEQCYCSPYTLLRLLADLLEDVPEKLLYLDADVLFQRDVSLLYDVDVSDCEYAAARDHYGKYTIHPNYINAGVLLFNVTKCKETGLFAKSRDLIRQKKLLFADQSALYRSTTKKKMLPQRFNDQKFLWKHTVVRHFSKRLFYLPYPHVENVKQWDVERMKKVFHYHQFDETLAEYQSWKEKMVHAQL